jgi:hypothetical protein
MSMFKSFALRLMPPQLYERVDKWTHEPWSNPTHLHTLLFLASFKSKNTKTHLLSCIHLQNPKYLSRIISTLLHCYLLYLHHHILFYLHLHLVLDNHSVELGTQHKEVVLQVAWRRTMRAFSTILREFDIKPRVPSWGKFTLSTTLYTWSPDELAPLLSVIMEAAQKLVRLWAASQPIIVFVYVKWFSLASR